MSPPRTTGRGHRWWLSGEETCVSCLGAYAYEVERRCARCDRGLCPHCSICVRITGVVVCAACEREGDAEPGDGSREGG